LRGSAIAAASQTMPIEDIIAALREAKTGARPLDVQIAEVIGWKTETGPFPDENGVVQERTLWISPVTGSPARIPYFTTNFQHAFDLVSGIHPDGTGACSWSKGVGAVVFEGDHSRYGGGSPQLALCIAALCIFSRNSPD
jgi:hypothetical protein